MHRVAAQRSDGFIAIPKAQRLEPRIDQPLGCGDGRIVIEAARRYGVRAVGIDIDPQRIAEANENARKEGVSHLVTFKNTDLFTTDISEATVVTLYLLPPQAR